MVVPKELRLAVLEKAHDSLLGGHIGRERTLTKLCRCCYWWGITTDVRLHVATCRDCNKNKYSNRTPRAPMTEYQAGCPGDRVHLDILGPFRESQSGMRYVLMVIDQFTRWLELVPLPTQEAEAVAKGFFEQYVVRFGVPLAVHTDQGRNFESQLFSAFCELLEVTKSRTTAYRPSANGQVERYNQLVLNYLRAFLPDKHDQWDQYLPALGMAVRATVNRSTGFTANMLQLGRELVMPMDLWLGLTSDIDQKFPAEYLQDMKKIMEEVHHGVRENLRQAIQQMKRTYDVKARVHMYDVGDLVYRKNSAHRKGLSRKLCPIYIGPYLITEVLSPYLYRVQERRKQMVLHHDKLKLCVDRNIPIWIRRRRQQLFAELRTQSNPVESTAPEEVSESLNTLEELPFADESSEEEETAGPDLEVQNEDGASVVDSSQDSTEPEQAKSSADGPGGPDGPGGAGMDQNKIKEVKEKSSRTGRTLKRPAWWGDFA